MERIRIGVYKEKSSGNFTIFPLSKSPVGYYTDVNNPLVVIYPFNAEEIGDACLKSIDTVITMSIAFEPQRGYKMIPTLGEKNGTFSSLGEKNGVQLDYSASKVELGEKVISTFYLCQ